MPDTFPPAKSGTGSPFEGSSYITSFSSRTWQKYLSRTRMNQKSIRYNDWEIPQLIHHISSALEMSQTVDEFRDDKFFECMREGRSGDSTEVSQKW